MRLCTNCLHDDDRKVEHCPICGHGQFAEINKKGFVVAFPASAGLPCQSCIQTGRDLNFRYYRRVVGMGFMDRIHGMAGYFCASCRRKAFAKHMTSTLLLGWWGYIAMFFRNPWAIGTNIYALFSAPPEPGPLGAINVNQMRENARDDQNLADAYMSMPKWFEGLNDDDLGLILAEQDHYAVLGVSRSMTQREIRVAWRTKVKEHHPDRTTAPDANTRMVEINNAHKILGDETLRHAYDHRDDLLAFLGRVSAGNGQASTEDLTGLSYGCTACHSAFYTYDDFADHVVEVHPHTDYASVLVHLHDGVPVENPGPSVSSPSAGEGSWRCKACGKDFGDYEPAVDHVDKDHPERLVVNVREAVEWVP